VLSLSDPGELKPADVYRQAQLVASKTSRGRDRNWYRSAFELPFQWHIWFDGGRDVVSATFSRHDSKWRSGPELPLASLTTGESLDELLGLLTTAEFFGQRPNALGVILHVADEFVLAELDQGAGDGNEEPEGFEMLHYRLIDDPRGVLIDREVNDEATSWRLLPFWGAPKGHTRCTSVALSRSREAFLRKLVALGESGRFPIRVAVTAAPVECLAALPLIEPDLTGSRLVVVIYSKFSAVFALDPAGELRRARSLSHRQGALTPHGLAEILWGMAVSEELAGPTESSGASPVKVLLLSTQSESLTSAIRDLQSQASSKGRLVWEARDLSESSSLTKLPGHRPEFLVHDASLLEKARSENGPLLRAETFEGLWKQWGAQCNYFDISKLDAVFPTLPNLRLLRLSSFIVFFLTLALVAVAGFGAYSFWAATQHPSWTLTPQLIKQTQEKLTKLQIEKRQMTITDELLQPRSKGWVALEFILRAFPEDVEVRVESFAYQMESARPTATSSKGSDVPHVGYARTWTLKGLAKEPGLERLGRLNSQRGLGDLFEQVAKATGDTSYSPDPSRELKIALTQGRNPKFTNQDPTGVPQEAANEYPFSFDATITQTVADSDLLALPTLKPF
jgi:hypothetical protein